MKKIYMIMFILAFILLPACGYAGEQEKTNIADQNNPATPAIIFDSSSNPEIRNNSSSSASALEKAEQLLFAGDYSKAMDEFQQAFNQTAEPEIKARALFGLGRTQNAARNCTSAVDSFTRILGQYSSTSILPEVYFYLGQCYEALQEYPAAINSYEKFAQLKPGIVDEIVRGKQAAVAEEMKDYKRAISFYQSALQSGATSTDKERINLKIGQAYANLQDYTTAIQIFQTVYDSSNNDYTKASADLLIGQAFLNLGMLEEASTYLLDAVIQFPRAYDSYTALKTLLLRNMPVDDKLRGIVDYYAGDYSDAIQSFEQYLSAHPEGEDGTAYYYLGLSHYFLNHSAAAIQAYDQLIQNYPNNRFWAAAWDEKAFVQWKLLQEYSNAATTLRTFVSRAPTTTEAPAYLFEAGSILERNNDLEAAISIWRQLADEYPAYERSYEAIFLSGIAYYRLNRYEDAQAIFQRNLILASSPEDKSAALLWIGKCYQKKNDSQNALDAWQQAEKLDPTGYYSIRAGQLIKDKKPGEVKNSYDLGYDLDYERAEAESWLRKIFKINSDVDLTGLGELATDGRILKGQELYTLGILDQANEVFETIQKDNETNPLNTYRLMNHFYSLGLYRLAINAARNILDLAGMDDLSSLSAPIYFTHVRFGAYFREQVMEGIKEENINPLILYSLLRQESLFDTTIVSSAGARGLAQFMPATGKETSDMLGWPPGYSVEDLNRPIVAIRFAANYLDRMTRYLNGDLFAGLAAYNAGAGNIQAWKELSQNDPDLFLEIIRLSETKTFLKHIIEFLNVYELVYTH